jgi:glycosyltransferase involved in cell wall biosynthesis
MRIAQVPPLYESVPPRLYGGTERVVSYLTEELVNLGHEVTLFGTTDSITNAKLYPVCDQAIRLNKDCIDPLAYHLMQIQEVADNADQFDIIHFHNDYLHFPLSAANNYTHITTLHGRLDIPELQNIYRRYTHIPLVSVSNNQRKPVPFAKWVKTVYHGLPKDLYQAGPGDGGYLAFIGRISPEKRLDRAIEIAKRVGIRLKIAAKVDKADTLYYKEVICPLLDHPLIEFIGEIGENKKADFLGKALGLLFPIDWPEPFGIVMTEAMACGTPVIAFNCGSVNEVIENGENGYKVTSVNEAVIAVSSLAGFDRKRCRQVFEERFTATTMAKNYLSAYEQLIIQQRNRGRAGSLHDTPRNIFYKR